MPTPDDTPRPEPGQRTSFELDHDGPAEALAEHMLVELRVVAARWGVDVTSTWVAQVTTILAGDDLSADLPAIRPQDPETGQ